jgi:hypothetical protein
MRVGMPIWIPEPVGFGSGIRSSLWARCNAVGSIPTEKLRAKRKGGD